MKLSKVLFNNYVTLKLPFFDPPIPHHHASSRMITRPHLRYVKFDTDAPFIIYFSFLNSKKTPKIRTLHNTSTHIFKQLNQIARFK